MSDTIFDAQCSFDSNDHISVFDPDWLDGEGLYIESHDADRYAEVRLSREDVERLHSALGGWLGKPEPASLVVVGTASATIKAYSSSHDLGEFDVPVTMKLYAEVVKP